MARPRVPQQVPMDPGQDKPANVKNWYCLYPAYINKNKSVAEGRRIAKDKAVIDPTCLEIRDVLQAAGLEVVMENKVYPREKVKNMLHRGRVRYRLKDENDQMLNPKFPDKTSVMLHAAETIPKLKSRSQRLNAGAEQSHGGQNPGAKKKPKKK